jgi:hypothetical protein
MRGDRGGHGGAHCETDLAAVTGRLQLLQLGARHFLVYVRAHDSLDWFWNMIVISFWLPVLLSKNC